MSNFRLFPFRAFAFPILCCWLGGCSNHQDQMAMGQDTPGDSAIASEIRAKREILRGKSHPWSQETKQHFESMILSQTMSPPEIQYAMNLYISNEQTNAIPFLMSIIENPSWDDNVKAYGIYNECRKIVSSRRHVQKNTPQVYEEFFYWASTRETAQQSRNILDDALVSCSSEWRDSDDRRTFLEKAMAEATNESLRSCFREKLDLMTCMESCSPTNARPRRVRTSSSPMGFSIHGTPTQMSGRPGLARSPEGAVHPPCRP